VDWQNSLDCLKFDNNFILNEKIQPISKINANAIVAHGQRELRFDTQPPFPKFVSQAHFVCALEKTGPKNGMHSHGRINNLPADRIKSFSATSARIASAASALITSSVPSQSAAFRRLRPEPLPVAR